MSNPNTTMTVKENPEGCTRCVEVYMRKRTPSWKRYGNGHAFVRLTMHKDADWLDIDVEEVGESSSKRTMVVLDGAEARALYDMLKKRFGGGA